MKEIKFTGSLPITNPDPRNYSIAQFIPNQDIITDEEFSLKLPSVEIILNQGTNGSCVAHSFCLAKQICEYNLTGKWIQFDPYIIYGTRFKEDNYYGEGMYSYQGAKALYKEGAFFRRDFNIDKEMPMIQSTVEKWKRENPEKVLKAKDYAISGYAYVYGVNGIKTSLKNNMPVSVCFPLYNSFYNVNKSGKVNMPKSNDKVIGYHQMTIVGWTKTNCWIVANSWGNKYGMKGIYYIPFDYPFDSAIAVSDTITPSLNKAKCIILEINKFDYIIDNQVKTLDSAPYIKNDRTYIPVRFVTEALGASVEWIESSEEVIIRSEEAIIRMKIGSKKYYIDNKAYNNDVAPELVNDRTMLPIRSIAEALNCQVEWNNNVITIKSL